MFYPLGFPVEVRTNSNEVLDLMAELWGNFEKQHDTEPIRSDVHVVEEGKTRIRNRYVVSAPVAGQMHRVPFKNGDRVKAALVADLDE